MVMGAEQTGGQRIIGCLGVGIVVLSKLTGLVLAAMAAQMICTGAKALLA